MSRGDNKVTSINSAIYNYLLRVIFSPWLISAKSADRSLEGSRARFERSRSPRTGGGGGIAAGGGGGGAPPALAGCHSSPVVWCFLTKS